MSEARLYSITRSSDGTIGPKDKVVIIIIDDDRHSFVFSYDDFREMRNVMNQPWMEEDVAK